MNGIFVGTGRSVETTFGGPGEYKASAGTLLVHDTCRKIRSDPGSLSFFSIWAGLFLTELILILTGGRKQAGQKYRYIIASFARYSYGTPQDFSVFAPLDCN